MSEIASGVLLQQLDLIATRTGENKWLTREQTSGIQQQIRQALSALPLPVNRLEEFDNCREAWRKCQAWLKILKALGCSITRRIQKPCLPSMQIFPPGRVFTAESGAGPGSR